MLFYKISWQFNFFSLGTFGGGDGSCSQTISSTEPIFAAFSADISSLKESCLAEFSIVNKALSGPSVYNAILDSLYNQCTRTLTATFTTFKTNIAATVNVSVGEVNTSLQEPAVNDPLNCISSKLLGVMPQYSGVFDALDLKVDELKSP